MVVNMTINKTPLVFSRVTCQIPNYESEILSLISAKDENQFYSQFIKKFLLYIPVDYKFRDRKELFGSFAHDAFNFFKKNDIGNRKLEITNTLIENNPAINILLLTNSKPFTVDSIICLLKTLNLKAKFLLHLALHCERGMGGQLQKILDIKTEASETESLVHLTILGNFDQAAINSLKNSLNCLLDEVDVTYNIWPGILRRIETLSNSIEDNQELYNRNKIDYREACEFLSWLQNDNFTFLGMIDFDVETQEFLLADGAPTILQDIQSEIHDIIKHSTDSLYENQILTFGKINTLSTIHRSNLIDYVLIKKVDKHGKYKLGSVVLGLYSSAITYQSVVNIPILRKKLQFIIAQAGFSDNRYNANRLKSIIQSFPREVLIRIDQGDLYCMCLYGLSSMTSRKLKLFIQQDWLSSFVNLIIFLPRDRLIPEVHSAINAYLSDRFAGTILSDYIVEVVENLSYLFVTIEVKDKQNVNIDIETIEHELDQISIRWSESFHYKLCQQFGEYNGGVQFKLFDQVFPADYREKFSASTALLDLEYLKEASEKQKPLFKLIVITPEEFRLRIYSPAPKLSLSRLLPPIENLGFRAIDEQSFAIKQADSIKKSWIYEFTLDSPISIEGDMTLLKTNVEEALDKMFLGFLSNDSLSKLIVLSGFSWWQVKLVKALTRYLHQTCFIYGKGYVQLTLIKHFTYTKMLINLFEAKFNPSNFLEERIENVKSQIKSYLNEITSSSEDKVLRIMFAIIEAIVRTNYYQPASNDELISKNYFSFKFDSHKVPGLPLPLPFAEIFVYANDFEAIHLRGGKVARGGIRWSDRGEDYRTEVLGLMKAQMTKNSVIVPVGSKGGFFLNFTQENMSRDAYMERVIICYKNFLRGLLDITDNIVDGKIIQPANTIIYDQEDPYLVVAADKGTATFSDYANGVASEYNFWLKDAFASGGSAGYDHKKMGITSKGAWISVINHFDAIGINVQKDPILVVGIGDMSGDVFGNGMLYSKTIKLVAAFNHKHIFLDPNPDATNSFNERARLFALPASNWSDYNPKLISKGGGVFERSSKSIALSPEVKQLLDLNADTLPPEDLIQAILQAKVDLLWNGGIGTYIKATIESHLEVGDKANDNLRVNGNTIRAKVIGEGGNVGVSQRGRIEYSKSGGRLNTDFIDNSAGVDCSDHEVNIKIALNGAMSEGKISLTERNDFLFSMTKQVEQLVLLDNHQQNQALNIMELSHTLTTGVFSQFIDTLEEEKRIDRAVEFLPTREEFSRREVNKEPMTRPELCVLLSYSKSSTYHDLMGATFSRDKYFESYLISYFPALMREKFRAEILSHPLKHEIIRTVVTNKIINQLSGPNLNIIKSQTGAALCDIVRSYTIVCEIFDIDNLWSEVEAVPDDVKYLIKIDMFTELTKIIRRGIVWFVKHIKHPINISNTIEEFCEPTKSLSKIMGNFLLGEAKIKYDEKISLYTSSGVPKQLAIKIATLDSLVSIFDILYVAKETKVSNTDVANLYFITGNKFSIDWLRELCDIQVTDSYWNKLSIQSLKDDLYDKQRRLLVTILKKFKVSVDLDLWISNNIDSAGIFMNFIKGIGLQKNIDLNILILANKEFEILLRRLE